MDPGTWIHPRAAELIAVVFDDPPETADPVDGARQSELVEHAENLIEVAADAAGEVGGAGRPGGELVEHEPPTSG